MNHRRRLGVSLLLSAAFGCAWAGTATHQPYLDSTGGEAQAHGSLLSQAGTRDASTASAATPAGFQQYADSTGGSSAARAAADLAGPARATTQADASHAGFQQYADSTGGRAEAEGDLLDAEAAQALAARRANAAASALAKSRRAVLAGTESNPS